MAYEKLKIACSPLTGIIYAGNLAKSGDQWAGAKKDVTVDAKMAVVDHLLAHREGSEIFTLDGGKSYFEITVKPVPAPAASDLRPEQSVV